MLKRVIIPFVLLSCLQSAQESQKSSENGREMLPNPELWSPSLEVQTGQNVTLSCESTKGTLPINYTFFRGNQSLSTMAENRKRVLLNLTIKSASDLGEYKCKAVNRDSSQATYSKGLNFTLLDPVSKPVLSTTTSRVRLGQNVTLTCRSENGSSPIKYLFFKRNTTISSKITLEGKAAAVLNVTINSPSDLGNYKCKAENKIPNNTKYSNSINFKLAEKNGISYVLCIFLALLFVLLVIAIALGIPFLILPSCKARKLKSAGSSTGFISTNKAAGSENYMTYIDIEYNKFEEVDYANISIIKKEEEDRKAYTKTDTRVVYSEIMVRDGTQAESLHSPE